jgi:hypothetical protein
MILDFWFLFVDRRSRKPGGTGGLSGSSGASLAQSSLSIAALTHLLLITNNRQDSFIELQKKPNPYLIRVRFRVLDVNAVSIIKILLSQFHGTKVMT